MHLSHRLLISFCAWLELFFITINQADTAAWTLQVLLLPRPQQQHNRVRGHPNKIPTVQCNRRHIVPIFGSTFTVCLTFIFFEFFHFVHPADSRSSVKRNPSPASIPSAA
jgi:hypothetical protein